MGVGIKDEKSLSHFVGLGSLVLAEAAHLPLAEAWHTVRVDSQQFSGVIARGPADASQGDLQALGFRHGVFGQEGMNGHVTGDEGKSVGQLEAALAEGALLPQPRGTQRRLMDHLQRQAWLDTSAALPAPTTEQVPSAQPQVFGNQEPEAHEVAGDLVGQDLPYAAFQAERIAGLGTGAFLGPLGLDLPISDRSVLIGFFFEDRTLR